MRFALPNLRGVLVPAAIAAGVVLTALTVAQFYADQPLVGLAVPGVLLIAIACGRWPALAVLAVLVLAGATGSLQAFFGIPSGPVSDAVLAGLWISVLFSYVVKARSRPWWVWPGLALILLFIMVTFLQIWTANGVGLGLLSFKYSAWYMMVIPLLAFAGWKLETYIRISNALVLAALGVAAYAVLRLIIGVSSAEWQLAMSSGGVFNTVGGELSLIGSFANRHTLASWSACAIPFCFAIALNPGKGLWRLAAAASIPLGLVALFGTDVRAGLAATAAGAGIVIALNLIAARGRGRPLTHALVAMLLVVVGGVTLFTVVLDEEETERYGAILSPSGDNAFEARLLRWEAVLEELDEQPMGFGLATGGRLAEGQTRFVTLGSYSIDSTYLKIAYEQGIPVVILYIAALLTLFVGLARRAIRTRAGPVRGLAIGAAGSLIAVLVIFGFSIFVESIAILYLWLAVGAAIGALGAIREEEMERTGEDPEARPVHGAGDPAPAALSGQRA
jgi:O-antigen ligase